MESFVSRMIVEYEELMKKVHALSKFLDTEDFEKMPHGPASLMMMQANAMAIYASALRMRIEYFTEQPETAEKSEQTVD